MIRDMESQLNNIQSPLIREYMQEAFRCYSIGAYRASVIMSTIGGINDLYAKIQNLSSSNKDISILEEEISHQKAELKPYERCLIEKCATPKIDLLSSNEAKELLRCFDIRNDCAHPSDYNCTPEVARYVFSTMIDILASKPILLGQNHISDIVNTISGDLFFPRINCNEIREIVNSQLSLYSKRLYIPLAKRLVKEIISNQTSNNNKHFFLSYLSDFIPNDFDSIISPLLIDSKNQNHFMIMLYINNQLINYLSHDNIKRLLSIFPNYLFGNIDIGYNSTIKCVLLSKPLSSSLFDDCISSCINFGYEEMDENRCNFWIDIMTQIDPNSHRFFTIIEDYKTNTLNKIVFHCQSFQQIFSICNNDELYHNFIICLSNQIANYDYTISNPATSILMQLDSNFVSHLSDDDIKQLVYSITIGSCGYGRTVKSLFEDLDSKEYFKIYVQKYANVFNINELKLLLSYNITDSSLLKFFKHISHSIPNFLSTAIQILSDYLSSEPYDDWNHCLITNVLNQIK